MGHSLAGEYGAAQRDLPSRRLAGADGEGNRDRPWTGFGHALDNQSGGCEITSVNDEIIAAALARFADQYLLGCDRAAMLQVQLAPPGRPPPL